MHDFPLKSRIDDSVHKSAKSMFARGGVHSVHNRARKPLFLSPFFPTFRAVFIFSSGQCMGAQIPPVIFPQALPIGLFLRTIGR